jgi:hypothetical protein
MANYNHKLYNTWSKMKDRCYNPNSISYPNYGGRGVEVCSRWAESFSDFLKDMGERPEGCSLDRLDVFGNYEPSNCRWATRLVQNNNRRDSRKITYRGVTKTLPEWARITGIKRSTLSQRFYVYKWAIDKCLGGYQIGN